MAILELIQGDITQCEVDAIVNAANTSLMGGGGVDGAIHRAAGSALLDDCRKIVARQGGCKVGEAVITGAGNLISKNVIHTVGPVWRGGNSDEAIKLQNCYENSLQLAVKHNIKSIAFPNISTGIYGYPKDLACSVAIDTVKNFALLEQLDRIIFVCFDNENFVLYQQLLSNNARYHSKD